MSKFAHMSDCHLGAHKEPVLQRMELEAFERAMKKCIDLDVDFVIIAGDLFHANLPDMRVVDGAIRVMRRVANAGIPIYVIYGSHDYSPNRISVVDILDSAGVFTKVFKGEWVDDRLRLSPHVDEKTGAKIFGLSARKLGLEKSDFEALDRTSLEREGGFKIFVFHSGLNELKPEYLAPMETIPLKYLPTGFDYYAGGHIHQRLQTSFEKYDSIVFPGPLFAGNPRDFETLANGEKRGFYLVDFDSRVRELRFIEIKVADAVRLNFDVSGQDALAAHESLRKSIESSDVKGRIVVLRVHGALLSGRTSDLGLAQLKTLLAERGALHIALNRHGLSTREKFATEAAGEDIATMERRVLANTIKNYVAEYEELSGDKGLQLALQLLKQLRQEQKVNETKRDYQERIRSEALSLLRLQEASA